MNNCNCKKTTECNKVTIDKDCNLIVNDLEFNCDYVQVFILKHIKHDQTQIVVKDSRLKKVQFQGYGDGFYTIYKLTIPINQNAPYYYENGKYYHNLVEISLQEILNTDPEVTGVQFDFFHYFSTCNLRKCFIKLCQDIFKSSTSICNKTSTDGALTYKRDLLWSALNVINYLAEMDQMEEAQRLLEEITECNGLCSPQTITNTRPTSRCGCGR